VVRSNGTKVSLVGSTHFDGNAQPDELFTSPIELLPGDGIITTCIYNSRDAAEDITWGAPKSKEMCMGTLFYYPKILPAAGCFDLQGEHLHVQGSLL
jgi:hypothetical protein